MLNIRRCTCSDLPALMAFIDRHWRKGHVLSTSRALMDWQHRAEDGRYNYLLAEEKGELLGVLGYIPGSRYDAAMASGNTLWLALWKIREGCAVAGLGLRMLKALEQEAPGAAVAVNGINMNHPPMYRALGYTVGELTQHYMINPALPQTLLSGPYAHARPREGAASLREVREDELASLTLEAQPRPQKSPRYFMNRFLRHPFYCYRVFLLEHKEEKALIAARIATHGSARVLRIVDMSGQSSLLAESGSALQKRMLEDEVEYADFWQHGLPGSAFEAAGFGVAGQGGTTAPNLFEPFVPSQGRILCAYKTRHPAFAVCRADGDQDRPNRLSA